MVLFIKMTVFLDVMLCTLVDRHHHFGGICYLCIHGRVENEGSVLLKSNDISLLNYMASHLTTRISL